MEGESKKHWYVIRCQTGREETIRQQLQKRVKLLGLEDRIGEVLIPTEKVTEIRSGKKATRERKIYPGYVMVHLELTDETWLAVRETPGIGDFIGLGKPVPMQDHEVQRVLYEQFTTEEERPKIKIGFAKGDTVRVKEGAFENFEGLVEEIDDQKGRISVCLTIFGRPTRVDLEYWQVEKL